MLDLKVAAEASADLDEILRFSIESFGEDVAAKYFDMLELAILRLREYPEPVRWCRTSLRRSGPPRQEAIASFTIARGIF